MLIQFGCQAVSWPVDPQIQLTHLGQSRIGNSVGRADVRATLASCDAVAIRWCAGPGGRFVRCLPCAYGMHGEGHTDRELATLNLTIFCCEYWLP